MKLYLSGALAVCLLAACNESPDATSDAEATPAGATTAAAADTPMTAKTAASNRHAMAGRPFIPSLPVEARDSRH